jgi:predicted SAM-dependent methyltransferase
MSELLRLNVGCGTTKIEGFIGIDRLRYPTVDCVLDFAKDGLMEFKENSVSEIRAYDFIEHIADKIFTLEQFYRVLVPNGIVDIQVPSTDCRGAFQDPTHVSYWNENSFMDYYMSGIYKYDAKYNYKVLSLFTTVPTRERVCWVKTKLMAIK